MNTWIAEHELPAGPGTYVLWMRVTDPLTLSVGRLGQCTFAPGEYAYVGSAHGPGGLRARLRRHLAPGKPQHWHIDALTVAAPVAAIWYTQSPERLECHWAQAVLHLAGVTIPAGRFGASDCRCPAHLFAVSAAGLAALWAALGRPSVCSRLPEFMFSA